MFSKAGPYLRSPEVTSKPNVVPKRYKLKKSRKSAGPIFNKETPKSGFIRIIAGTIPINVLNSAVDVNVIIISLTFNGEANRFVKFLLQISSKNSMLKLMLDLKRKS